MHTLAEDLLKGAKAAAAYTGLTERAIYHLVDNERIPHTKIGRDIFFRKSLLDQAFSGKAA